MKDIEKEFRQHFDIDRIKNRSEHQYFEGEEAEKRILKYIENLIHEVCKEVIGEAERIIKRKGVRYERRRNK